MSMANGQAGSVCDELGARDRRHAPPAIRCHGQKMGTQARDWSLDSISKSEHKIKTDIYLKNWPE